MARVRSPGGSAGRAGCGPQVHVRYFEEPPAHHVDGDPGLLEDGVAEGADYAPTKPPGADPTRLGTTDEATGLSTEGLPNTAQVEDQRRRVENGTGLTHGVDGESAPNERCDARGSRRLVPELSDGLKELVWRAEQLDAAAQTCKGPFHPSRFCRRRRMRRT